MITNLASAALKDLMSVAFEGDYFNAPQSKRDTQIDAKLGKTYPKSLRNYVASVSEAQFTRDCEAVIPVLGSGESIAALAKTLAAQKNGWFDAFVDGLSAIRSCSGQSHLAQLIELYKGAGTQYARVLDRELQQLLLGARGEDSPIIQIATASPVDPSGMSGVPSVEVNKSLIGGARSFHNGVLRDDSWKARLTEVISVIS